MLAAVRFTLGITGLPCQKARGSYRFCVDYRRVNAVFRKDAYPIPDIQDDFDSLRGRNTWRPLIFFRAIGK